MKKTIITIFTTLLVISNLLPDTLVLEYRNPLALLSWEVGEVIDEEGNGVITSPFVDSYYNYIKYEEGLEKGTKIFTIFVYNPLTLYGDDTIGRFDF